MSCERRCARLRLCALWLGATALIGCGETAQDRVSIPLYARGVVSEPFEVDGFTVQLTRAQVGLGPLYLCASARSSSELCPSAVAEFTSSVTMDALDESSQRLGTLSALTADARSIGFDYAITWPPSAARAAKLRGAPSGHSAVFEGHAERGDRRFDFRAEVDAAPLLRGTRAVQGLTTRAKLTGDLRCELGVDPVAWWSQVDFEALANSGGDRTELAPDSAALDIVVIAMTSNSTPTVTWSSPMHP